MPIQFDRSSPTSTQSRLGNHRPYNQLFKRFVLKVSMLMQAFDCFISFQKLFIAPGNLVQHGGCMVKLPLTELLSPIHFKRNFSRKKNKFPSFKYQNPNPTVNNRSDKLVILLKGRRMSIAFCLLFLSHA